MEGMIERAEEELRELNFWFKMNSDKQGTIEWSENIERGSVLMEIVLDL